MGEFARRMTGNRKDGWSTYPKRRRAELEQTIEALEAEVLALQRANEFWTEGITICYSSILWCPACNKSFAKTDKNIEDGNCTACTGELSSEETVKDAGNIRFPVPRCVTAEGKPWRWTPGSPVTWKDLVVKEPRKESRVDDGTSQSHAPQTPKERKAREAFEHVTNQSTPEGWTTIQRRGKKRRGRHTNRRGQPKRRRLTASRLIERLELEEHAAMNRVTLSE